MRGCWYPSVGPLMQRSSLRSWVRRVAHSCGGCGTVRIRAGGQGTIKSSLRWAGVGLSRDPSPSINCPPAAASQPSATAGCHDRAAADDDESSENMAKSFRNCQDSCCVVSPPTSAVERSPFCARNSSPSSSTNHERRHLFAITCSQIPLRDECEACPKMKIREWLCNS